MAKRRTKGTVAALMKSANEAARRLQGSSANWIDIRVKPDRSGVVLTTVRRGEELAYIVFNAQQLDEFLRLLETSREDLREG